MYIKVRGPDCKHEEIVQVTKLTAVEDLKVIIQTLFDIESDRQRLFYKGKQLENGYQLFDYNIQLNDVIQLIKKEYIDRDGQTSIKADRLKASEDYDPIPSIEETWFVNKSRFFKVGDAVDYLDPSTRTWFEGKITKIFVRIGITKDILSSSCLEGGSNSQQNNPLPTYVKCNDNILSTVDIEILEKVRKSCSCKPVRDDEGNLKGFVFLNSNPDEDGYIYEVENLSYPIGEIFKFSINEIRPRAQYLLSIDELVVGDLVMVNYNTEEPGQLGSWVDFIISSITNTRARKIVEGSVLMRSEPEDQIENVKLINPKEIYRIEQLAPLAEHPNKTEISLTRIRPMPVVCDNCEDRPKRKCTKCGCNICGGKENPNSQIVCDQCNYSYHFSCLDPPIQKLPEDDWYCSNCKTDVNEIVKAGEKLKRSVKKENMPSKKTGSSKWGSGMANIGRTQVCSIVSKHHFGPIPGIEVGTSWLFRMQVSEAGVHRAPLAGIHGRQYDGAYAIVLSGGYEDDEDNGDSFWYTGSGGRDLSGNKRTSVQSCDQKFKGTNRALALNCAAKINEKGAVAKDWKKGKPVRVCRSSKAAKHSKYAPKEGIRYDGIYKVVKYKPVKGKSGFVVWRYLLRRDDTSPAPWTPEGKAMIESLGLEMEMPQNYTAAMKNKKAKLSVEADESTSPKKKRKVVAYELEDDIEAFIAKDTLNIKVWDDCKKFLSEGKKKYLEAIKLNFLCICCQDLVYEPVTSACGHNFCMACMKRAYKAEVYTCPVCRTDFGNKFNFVVNNNLFSILKNFFPGYGTDH